MEGHAAVVATLLAKGALVDKADNEGSAPLHAAAAYPRSIERDHEVGQPLVRTRCAGSTTTTAPAAGRARLGAGFVVAVSISTICTMSVD